MSYLKTHRNHAEYIELYCKLPSFELLIFVPFFSFLGPSNRIPEYSELTHKDPWVLREWPIHVLNPWPWGYQQHALNKDFTMILKNASFFPKPVLKTLRKMLFSLAVWSLKFIWGILFRDRDYLVSYKEQPAQQMFFCRPVEEKYLLESSAKLIEKLPDLL